MVHHTATGSSPKTSTKRDFLIFISIPLGIIIVVILMLVVPSLLARPSYDFVYSYCPSYENCSENYIVGSDGVLKVVASTPSRYDYQAPRSTELYYHDIHSNSSRRITADEAKSYQLDASNVSPDGYKLTQSDSSGGGFLFWGSYSSGDDWHLKKSSWQKTHALNLSTGSYSGVNDVKLLGWVQK